MVGNNLKLGRVYTVFCYLLSIPFLMFSSQQDDIKFIAPTIIKFLNEIAFINFLPAFHP